MGRQKCDKKGVALAWTLLECVFFSGVALGWSWLALVFRADHYLLDVCNVTIPDHLTTTFAPGSSTPRIVTKKIPCKDKHLRLQEGVDEEDLVRVAREAIGNNSTLASAPTRDQKTGFLEPEEEGAVCLEQRELLRLLFATVAVLRDLFVLPLGAFLDKYGTTRTRLITVLSFAVGSLTMTFTSKDRPWLTVPALTLTGVAGVAVLLTNVQIANMFGRRRHLVMALYCGASLSSGFITYMMQLSREHGVDVQTSFMFLTIGLVPMLVSTVAFLPKTRVPWPLPANYGKRRNQSLDENLLRKQRAWQRRLSEAGVAKLRRPAPQFWPKGGCQLLVGAIFWYGVQSLHSAQVETTLVDTGHWKDALGSDMERVFGWTQLLATPLAVLPGLLIDRRSPREIGVTQGVHQMQNIVPAFLLTSLLAIGERTVLMLGGDVVPFLVLAFLLHVLHRVFQLTTTLAFLMHVHFAQEHVGKYVGLILAVSAFISAFQFPLRLYLQRRPLVVHPVLLILLLLTLGHGVVVWRCCKRLLIRDHPERSKDYDFRSSGQALLAVHIHTDDSNLRQEGSEAQPGTSSQGPCPGTSRCCPGPSGHGQQGNSQQGQNHGQGESQPSGGPQQGVDQGVPGAGPCKDKEKGSQQKVSDVWEEEDVTDDLNAMESEEFCKKTTDNTQAEIEETHEAKEPSSNGTNGQGQEGAKSQGQEESKGQDRHRKRGAGKEREAWKEGTNKRSHEKAESEGLHVVIKEPDIFLGIDT